MIVPMVLLTSSVRSTAMVLASTSNYSTSLSDGFRVDVGRFSLGEGTRHGP